MFDKHGAAEQRTILQIQTDCPMPVAEQPVFRMIGVNLDRDPSCYCADIEMVFGIARF
jgi:hypothetical protein